MIFIFQKHLFILTLISLITAVKPDVAIAQAKKDSMVFTPEYKNAIGIRAGRTAGVVFKHFTNREVAYETILGLWQNAVGLTFLVEKHASTGLLGLKFYYGGGAHITKEAGRNIFRRFDNNNSYRYRYGEDGFAVGVDGIVGIDWKIGYIPVALSFDLKPFLELSNHNFFYVAVDPGLGIKFTF